MSRAQTKLIEDQAAQLADLREQVAELQGELRGERRGEHRVAEQLAADVRQSALREEAAKTSAGRAVEDVRRLLRMVAGHVLELRAGTEGTAAAEALVGLVARAGLPITGAIIRLQIERADAITRTDAHMSAAALASAPVSTRTA